MSDDTDITIEEARKRIEAVLGNEFTYFIDRRWKRYAYYDGATALETCYAVALFYLPATARHPGDTACVATECVKLVDAVDEALKRRQEAIDRAIQLVNESATERDVDQVRADIAHGERLPDGRPA